MKGTYPEYLEQVKLKHFINGQFKSSASTQSFPVINPANEQVIAHASQALKEDVDQAVKAARSAFKNVWKKTDSYLRGKILNKISQLVIKNMEWLAHYQSLNCGKPISKTMPFQLGFVSMVFSYFAGQADKINGKTLQMMQPFVGWTIKEPVGVVGAILPWNYPLALLSWKVAAALAAGCTMVIKPAEETPFTALMLCKIFQEAGVPNGVVNVVTGDGRIGQLISTHKGIDKITFTGSTEVGYSIMRNSHKENLKTITLELGGKSALIVCPDAPIESSAQIACQLWNNCGQSCVSASRVFVHESIYDQFVKRCVKLSQNVVHGDPFDQNTTQGPVISKIQFDKILGYIKSGVSEGAKLAVGGERWGEKGFYIKPTIFIDVEDHMKIAKQQIFGPVISILRWKDEDQVIQRANSLPYGLGAGVLTPNIDRAIKFAKQLQAGSVYINNYEHIEPCTPFGGYKDSGIGKDLGDEGLEAYLLTKTIIIKPSI